jgi:hypothetical protein
VPCLSKEKRSPLLTESGNRVRKRNEEGCLGEVLEREEAKDMPKATRIKQLSFSLPNRIGLLSELSSFLTAARINIEAVCAYGMGDEGYFMIVTDNNAKARKVIFQMGAEVTAEEVIAVEMPNRVGQLRQVAKQISDAGVDIRYIYGSPVKGKMTVIVKTADDKKALRALNR